MEQYYVLYVVRCFSELHQEIFGDFVVTEMGLIFQTPPPLL